MLNIRLPGFHKTLIIRERKGFTLIEVLIAIALAAVIVSGVIITIGTASKMLVRTKNKETAKDIASMEMEYIRSQNFAGSYPLPALPAIYNNFTVTSPVVPSPLQLGEQKVEIDVFLKGAVTPIFTLVDYRVSY